MTRGDHREPIFRDDPDGQRFLGTLGGVCTRTGRRVHAYCLMAHQFHLVLETPHSWSPG